MANDKMTKTEVATMLKEALEPFCETLKNLRPALAHPFRQEDCVMASDGHVLVAIKAKEAGVSISKFKEMTDFNARNVIPQVGFNDLLKARTIERIDLLTTIDEMKRLEKERQQVTAADVLGVWLSIEGLSRIEVAMRICGADAAQLVWHKDGMVAVQLYNAKGKVCVTILSMGFLPKDAHVITLPTHDDDDHCSVTIDWQKGAAAWADIKAELARQEEAERMARREVYMVEVVKRAYIPVYAKDADEARRLCESEWFDPEDDGDDEWMLGDTVPEVEDLDDMDDCYEHVITRDGIVERDKIYDLDQISEEWAKEHKED
jgi:hypothetical protein